MKTTKKKKAKEAKIRILLDQQNSRPTPFRQSKGEKKIKHQPEIKPEKDINNKQNPICLRNEDVIFPNKISIHQPDNIIQLYITAKWNLPQGDSLDTHQDISSSHYRKAKSISKSHNKANPTSFQCIASKKIGVCEFVQT